MAISAPSRISGYCSGLMSGFRWISTLGSPGFSRRSKITASDSLASTKTPRMAFPHVLFIKFYLSGCDAGQRQHGMHQHIGARRAIGLGRVLKFVVTDAVLAGHEHHGRRHHGVEVAGIMAGAGGDAAMGKPKHLRGVLH